MTVAGSIGIGVVGVGFMGSTHVRAWQAAARDGLPCRLAAVCDSRPERLSGRGSDTGNLAPGGADEELFDPARIHVTTELAALLADPAVDAVSVCTRTDTHVGVTLAAIGAGKHVLVEKPVALDPQEIEGLQAAARTAGVTVMPAHCMRFWPGWSWLRERVARGDLGAVRSAVFRRLGSGPTWSRDFYADPARSGGALMDLHVHDADFIRWCFGEPDGVAATGTRDHLTALYRYTAGPAHVAAEGGWDHTAGYPFRMRYTVVFDGATADFDLGRDPELLLFRDGEGLPVEIPALSAYDAEIRHFLDVLVSGAAPIVTLHDAAATARLLIACGV
jgi:predicted dehydrogenase